MRGARGRVRRLVRDRHALDGEVRPFGWLLTLDLYGCKPGTCDDLALCYAFLEELVKELGMTTQAPPFLFRSPQQFPDKAGLSGWVPLIESGIQIHTLSPKSFVSVDVYCCREIRMGNMTDLAKTYFEPRQIEVNHIPRGLKYHDVG